jgi:hypothetical protein
MAIVGTFVAFALCRLLVEKESTVESGKASNWSEAFIFSLSFAIAGAFALRPAVRLVTLLFRVDILAGVSRKTVLTTILGIETSEGIGASGWWKHEQLEFPLT